MSSIFKSITLLLMTVSFCCADEPTKTTLRGFDYLKQFEGSWTTTSRATGSEEAAVNQGTFECSTIGRRWIVIEQHAEISGMKFKALQTVGYNAKEKKFRGNWVDSTADHKWEYDGTLDDKGTLILNADGPDWTDPNKMRKFRDVYKFASPTEINLESQMKNDAGEWETFMTSTITKSTAASAKTKVLPFLMFTGQAEAAIGFYKTVFPNVSVENMKKYKAGEAGPEGTIQLAYVSLEGQTVMMTDSPPVHDFTFTPSFSFFVECENEAQLKERFAKLSDGGNVMMPLNNYGFSKQFGWCSDKFGISWQLNLK